MAEVIALTADKEYVPKSAGLSMGDTGGEVERLQAYLTQFGYLDSPAINQFGVGEIAVAGPTPSTGTFDAPTEAALKRFQEMYGLDISGVLDQATLDLMNTPRCGFVDTAAFVLQGNKWTKTALTYGFQNFTPDLSQAAVRTAFSQAFALWAAVTPLTFTEVAVGSSPDIVVRFVTGDHGDGSTFDGAGGILAHAFYPPPNGGALAGDAHFDDAETWSVNTPASGIDLVSVVAHEIGHALGLAHSTVTGALMYPYYSGIHRAVEADDIAGIQALYGGGGPKWSGWESLGGVLTSGPGVSSWASGRLDVFVRGTDNALYHKWFS